MGSGDKSQSILSEVGYYIEMIGQLYGLDVLTPEKLSS
jgi:hypothetical protein